MMDDALAVLGLLVVAVVAVRLLVGLLVRRHVETLDFRGPVRALEVAVGAGEVTVRGSKRRDARVRRKLHYRLRRPRTTEHVEDGVLQLEARSGVVQYEIDVPAGASVQVRGRGASATIIGLTGAVRLQAVGGSIEGRALGTSAVSALTDGGSIRLSFDSPPGDVDAASTAGSVFLTLPGGPYDIDAGADGGDTRVAVPTTPGARCRVRVRSSAGSVRIRSR